MKGKFVSRRKGQQLPFLLRTYVYIRLMFTGGSYIDKDGHEWEIWPF